MIPEPGVKTPTTDANRPLRICVLGLGGGGFHREVQTIIKDVARPLELILVFSGPGTGGGIRTWETAHSVRSVQLVRSPSLMGDSPIKKFSHTIRNVLHAFRILREEQPDLILVVSSARPSPSGWPARSWEHPYGSWNPSRGSTIPVARGDGSSV